MLGYFSVYKSGDEKYSGGVLIINEKGMPVSFKYTSPIKPTKIQKIIYGNNLKSYIASEIIGKKISEIAKDAEVLLVQENETLDFLSTDKPVAQLVSSKALSESSSFNGKEGIITLGQNYSAKISFSSEVSQELFKKISDLAEIFDILEPFVRLNEALSYVCSSEEG